MFGFVKLDYSIVCYDVRLSVRLSTMLLSSDVVSDFFFFSPPTFFFLSFFLAAVFFHCHLSGKLSFDIMMFEFSSTFFFIYALKC